MINYVGGQEENVLLILSNGGERTAALHTVKLNKHVRRRQRRGPGR